MGTLTLKEELVGLVRTILFFITFLSAGIGAVSIVKLIEWVGDTLAITGWENKIKFLISDLFLLGIFIFMAFAGFGIAYISKTISNRLMIKPTHIQNREQTIAHVTFGKWLKIGIVPKDEH